MRFTDSMDMNVSKLWEIEKDREAWLTWGKPGSPWGHKESDTT